MAPHGTISKDKWDDLLEGFRLEMSQNTRDWVIAKMFS
jgi:hypothetical protein